MLLAMFLDGKASIWFNDNIDSMGQCQDNWTFKNVMTGLYDWFIHKASIQDAMQKFYDIKYSKELGVHGFYQDLDRYALCMIHQPNTYTFKLQFLMNLPQSIVKSVVDKGVMAETSSLQGILVTMQDIEEGMKLQHQYEE
jgi:hypothetical protein